MGKMVLGKWSRFLMGNVIDRNHCNISIQILDASRAIQPYYLIYK